MPKTISVEDITNIRLLVGGKPVDPSRIQMRDGTLTIAMQKANLSQIGQEQPWYGEGGLQALIYALVASGIERPVKLAPYLDASRECITVTMKFMVDKGILVRIRKGHYTTAERSTKGLSDRVWKRIVDQVYRQDGYLSIARSKTMFDEKAHSLLPTSVYAALKRQAEKREFFWGEGLYAFQRAVASGLLAGKYRIAVPDDEIYTKHRYAFVRT